MWSLSARRAWIEIQTLIGRAKGKNVALRKESVDRNPEGSLQSAEHDGSLSARRAWIEIFTADTGTYRLWSLSARRAWIEI